MKLYEALKSGTSAEDLEAAFRKELAAAQEQISKEKNQEINEARLKECRDKLSTALSDYASALTGKESSISIVDIEKDLLNFEQELTKLTNLTNKLKSFKVPKNFVNNDDDVIIESFLNSLR